MTMEGINPPESDYNSQDDNTITSLEYSMTGDYLATGDRGGRITVLKLDAETKSQKNQESWLPYFQFQSHEPEFDFLKSLELEGKINQIKFCHPIGDDNFILSTNDKTIKLWKIGPKKRYKPKASFQYLKNGQIVLPEIDETVPEADLLHAYSKKVYANAHSYHINSLALSSDMETFISADDLRINMWKLDNSDTTFTLVDIKPENMEELTEVITSVQCHPQHSNLIAFSSSRGAIKLCDTRTSALCHEYSKIYTDASNQNNNKHYINDILSSISDINYSSDGRYIIARDYMTIKIWDTTIENRPLKVVPLHDYLRPHLYDLYTNDYIFDKFEISCSSDGKSMATGSYSNQLKIYHQDSRGLRNVDLPRLNDDNPEGLSPNSARDSNTMNEINVGMDRMKINGSRKSSKNLQSSIKLDEKVLHCAWHPQNNTIAVAGKSGLCLYKV